MLRSWKFRSHTEIITGDNLGDLPSAAPLPKKRVRLRMKRHEMQEIRAKKHGKLGRTKEAGGLGYLSNLRPPVVRSPTEADAVNAGNILLLLETQKGQEEPAACLNGPPVFVQTPIRSNIQFGGHIFPLA